MRKLRAWIITGPGRRIHLDKIARDKAECWGLLRDELAPTGNGPKIVEMRRLGYDCRAITISVPSNDSA